jgi:hypothetical protein
MPLSSRSKLHRFFIATFMCNLVQANKYFPSLPDRATAATVATTPNELNKTNGQKARDIHEIHTLRSTRSFGWRPTPLASPGLWPPGWQVRLETVSSRADGQQLSASGTARHFTFVWVAAALEGVNAVTYDQPRKSAVPPTPASARCAASTSSPTPAARKPLWWSGS